MSTDGAGGPLAPEIRAFVRDIAAELAALSGKPAAVHEPDVVVEASNLAAAIMDADGRVADAELRAYLDGIGPLLDPPLFVTPSRLREGGLLDGRAGWLARPSVLAELLISADGRHVTRRSHRYYAVALQLAHAVAAVDLVPSAGELEALDRFRTTLLQAMDLAGVPRPGQPDPRPPAPARGGVGHRDTGARPRRRARGPAAGAQPRRGARRARCARRPLRRQGRSAAPDEHVAGAIASSRARSADAGGQPPPRVHRQPGHRQDDRRPPAGPDLPRRRRRVEGPTRRDRPQPARRRLRRPDRAAHA